MSRSLTQPQPAAQPPPPAQVHLWYREELAAPDQPGNYSKSPTKPRRYMAYLRQTPLWPHLTVQEDFAPVSRDDLLLAHTAQYADAVLHGSQPLCEANGLRWTPQFRDTVVWTNGCLLAALTAATNDRSHIALAPVSGFHHARPHSGSGYCTFSGQVLAAMRLYQQRQLRGAWIDLDGHYGNSIEDSRSFAPQLTDAIPLWANLNPSGSHQSYLEDLTRKLAILEARADQLDYVCVAHGADSHEWDQLGHQCTTAEWLQAADLTYATIRRMRDAAVLAGRQPPALALALFGGYRDDDPESVLALHAMDLASCLRHCCDVQVAFAPAVRPPGGAPQLG